MEWEIELLHLFVSGGHNYVGRHGQGSLDHGIEDPGGSGGIGILITRITTRGR